MKRTLLLIVVAALAGAPVFADAIFRTRAMVASTIVEFYIEADGVRVELEIGARDLPAFARLLPDELWVKLGNEPRPLGERFPEFFRQDLVVTAGGGDPIVAQVVAIEARARIPRDELSGEPLPLAEGEEPEPVMYFELFFPFASRPDQLTLGAPGASRTAEIGFVAYHRGLPVNDFRYLGTGFDLTLDWDDPWYSRFDARPLRRTYFAAMNGFLYIEPYEVRKEIILRPRDLRGFLDLGLDGLDVIPAAMQPELTRQVAAFLRDRHKVVIDGRVIEPELARINFLRRSLRNSTVIDPPVDLDAISATLGIIFVYPTDGLPKTVTMDWDLWTDRIDRVPVAAVDQAGPLPSMVTPDAPTLVWQNFLKNPDLPTLVEMAAPPAPFARATTWLRWVLLIGVLVGAVWTLRGMQAGAAGVARRGVLTAVLLAAAAGTFYVARGSAMNDDRARELVGTMLHNVYRAFDFRGEEQIYDVLARTVEGDLLIDIYLETRRGLEIRNQGGARAKVKTIDLVELETSDGRDGGFIARAVWNVAGSVGHWGHVHGRTNRYRADLDIRPVDGHWKIVGMTVLDETRL